jgi:nitrile hydratase
MTEGDHVDAGIATRVRDLENALETAGIVSGVELDAIIDNLLRNSSPLMGARLVARAWADKEFHDRLLLDGTTAIEEFGLSMRHGVKPQTLRVVENTDEVHNLIVCTLCSCYPIAVLGPSPAWYKSEAYRSRAVRDPRSVLAEFGFDPGPDVEIRVWDANAETRYLVLPRRPSGTEDLDEATAAKLVTRNGMIGTAAV